MKCVASRWPLLLLPNCSESISREGIIIIISHPCGLLEYFEKNKGLIFATSLAGAEQLILYTSASEILFT